MARLEGRGGRVSDAAQGELRRFEQRGAARLGLVALAAGLLGVNWLGWVRYGAAAGREVQAAGSTASGTDATGGGETATADATAALGNQRRQPLALLHALPTEGVARASTLSVVFDGAVVALAPGQGVADLPELTEVPFNAFERTPSGAYEPLDLAGRWSWGGPDRLDFTLETPLGAGRSVRFEPTAALEGLAGRPAAKGLRPEWTSEPLAVRAVRLRSCDREALTVEVDFNAPVDALSLAAALAAAEAARAEAAPSPAGPRSPGRAPQVGALLDDAAVLSTGSELTHTVRYKRSGDARRVRLHFPASVLPARGALGLGTPYQHNLELPASFDVIGHWIEHARHADQAVVRIRFDRPLVVGQEEPPVKVTPEVTPLTARFSGQQLVLDGGFEARGRYTIEIGGSLLAVDGQTLGRPRTIVCEIPPRDPDIELEHNRGILAPGGGLTLPLTATNVRAVRVTATKVLPGNLVPHLRGEQSEYTSNEVLSEVFPLTVSPDRPERRALDLRALFGDAAGGVRGVYSLELRSTEDYWTRATAVIRITDLVVTLKEDRGAVHAWVQSLASGAPVGGAAVSALTVTDQLVASGVTDDAGYVALEVPRGERDSRVFVVTAERDGDLAYTRLDGSAWSIPKELAEGRIAPELADVYVYTERRMYRPGDTVHLTGIARTPEGLRYSGPMMVRTLRPDGLELARQEVSTELVQGLFHLDVPTPLDARTGTYTVEVEAADARGRARCVGRARFEVEAFLAARLTLTAEPPVPSAPTDGAPAPLQAVAGDATRHVQVKSLADTSVAGYPVRIAARWTPVAFESTSRPELRFGTLGPEREVVRAEWVGVLDAAGRAEVAPPGANTLPPGRWAGRLEWTVTEPGGRSVSTVEALTVERPATHLGLGLDGLVRSGSDDIVAVAPGFAGPLAVQWLTVDAAGNATVAPALAYELARVEHVSELVDMGGSFAWRASERLEVLATGTLARGDGASEGRVEVPAELHGATSLRLTVRAPESQPVSLDFYLHRGAAESFVRPLEGLDSIELSTLGGATRPGEVIEVDVRAPFDGSLLVTLEDTRLRAQRRVELVGGSARIAFTVPRDVRGDVFVAAQVTRPLERQTAWRPHRAHGWLRVKTLHADQRLSAALTVPERVHPGSLASVEVAVDGLAEDHAALVHLFAVDEGIRITGGDRLPDPAGHFFAPRRHSTRTTDGWFDLLPDTELPPEVRLIGGDGDLGSDRARQRAPEEVRKAPGIVWQHAVALDRDGRQRFELEVPDFVGTLTWIAVVVDGDRYGASSAATLVRGDLPLLTTFPRFLAPGDRFVVPVAFENPNEVAVSVGVELELTGPARYVGIAAAPLASAPVEASFVAADERQLEPDASSRILCAEDHLEPGAVVRRWLVFEVEDSVESGRIAGELHLVGAFADGRAVRERAAFDVPVRTGRPLVVAGLVRGFTAGQPYSLDVAAALGLDTASPLQGRVSLSSSYGVTLEPLARYALDYPYGCAEQTASRILALLSLPKGVAPVLGLQDPEAHAEGVRERVLAGIDRLWSMRTSDGGVAYWPGQNATSEWATAYTAEVLARCRDAGYDVPQGLVDNLARYLERRISAQDVPLASRVTYVRVLAALGRPLPGWWQSMHEQRRMMPRSARIELALAALSLGREADAREVLAEVEPLAPSPSSKDDDGTPSAWARLGSGARALALELELRLALGEGPSELVPLIAALDGERRTDGAARFATTLDNATALRALTRFSAVADRGADWRGSMAAGARSAAVSGAEEASLDLRAGETIAVETEGSGQVWLRATVTGRRAADAPATDAGLVVRRKWSKQDGSPLDTADIRLGDLIAVDITLESASSRSIDDVVIVDTLPAGFEVENTRLAGSLVSDEDPSDLRPERVEFLDDRVLVFATAHSAQRRLRYHVRAVQVGTFEHAPVQAEAMYDPTRTSVGGATQRVVVR